MLLVKAGTYILGLIVVLSMVQAATIHGSVYDFSLKKLNNARVEINTIPRQQMIAQNGSYLFNVPTGRYTLKARIFQRNISVASIEENITITREGTYVLDLILLPDIASGIVDEPEIEPIEDVEPVESNEWWFLLVFVALLAVAGGYVFVNKQKKEVVNKTHVESKEKIEKQEKKHDDSDLNTILKFLKQEDGRTTQKDIRKVLPYSEAKISLMIAELEHKGIIEKIKKGRGNIIILKQR